MKQTCCAYAQDRNTGAAHPTAWFELITSGETKELTPSPFTG
jgi:hypothetical protein